MCQRSDGIKRNRHDVISVMFIDLHFEAFSTRVITQSETKSDWENVTE